MKAKGRSFFKTVPATMCDGQSLESRIQLGEMKICNRISGFTQETVYVDKLKQYTGKGNTHSIIADFRIDYVYR